jgi:GTP-binding protein HflX
VGFIRDLPEDLVNAFRATLEELDDADLLLHVVDAADPRFEGQMKAVDGILRDLRLHEKPRLLVFNKADALPAGHAAALAHAAGGVAVSARTRDGLTELLRRCDRILWSDGKSTQPPRRDEKERGDEPARLFPAAVAPLRR